MALPSHNIRIVSFNVLASEYSRFNTDSGSHESDTAATERWQRIADLLAGDLAADVIALLEATLPFVRFLATVGGSDPDAVAENAVFSISIGQTSYCAAVALRRGKPDGAALLWKADVLDLVDESTYGIIPVHFTAATRTPRMALVGLFTVAHAPADAGILAIAATHLEGNPRRSDVRAAQLVELASAMHNAAIALHPTDAEDKTTFVIAGDFNHSLARIDGLDAALAPLGLTRLTGDDIAITFTQHNSRSDSGPIQKTIDHMPARRLATGSRRPRRPLPRSLAV
ncbi:uncharacterized protein AMSG_00482 [Thecamonas trahens ATCC 50062]|uniref:Endonuclease/exonuclease/phosphatase domain-containing protein n=1 Tax=Thecamonas trahens ATCC 50062 TaxID=461836 RepID=A0A0L0D900_THETB|nr:hypothetical protein AMSG_00482 [Thecamonas trahens ATCC 50062]KNC48705.1 hypothetical protein AMSG_00482 [Thecamonas trahens ATCC 50062]|eukprot:XP_013762761.1 hypothetical protein AMSG_00482 [Thecamonas trahens ATCC 50062]